MIVTNEKKPKSELPAEHNLALVAIKYGLKVDELRRWYEAAVVQLPPNSEIAPNYQPAMLRPLHKEKDSLYAVISRLTARFAADNTSAV